jgi:hypothetical protein
MEDDMGLKFNIYLSWRLKKTFKILEKKAICVIRYDLVFICYCSWIAICAIGLWLAK